MKTAIAFLRSCLHMLWMIATLIPWALLVLMASIFIRGRKLYWLSVCWLRMAVWGAHVILGITVKIHGAEHLPQSPKARLILLVKHQSTLETFLMPSLLKNPLAFVFKRELLYIPFFGWSMARLDMIHINRSQRGKAFNKVVAQGRKLLEHGIWVILFPEGTRIARGKAGTYKTGGTRLAVQTNTPVMPVAVTTARCWPRKAFIKYPGTVDVIFHAPISSTGRDPQDLMDQVQATIEASMHQFDSQAYCR